MRINTRGMRITDETLAQLQRLTRLSGKPQYAILAKSIARTYQETLDHPKWGPLLRGLEEMDLAEGTKMEPVEKRPRTITLRFNEGETQDLFRWAYEATGDPGQAHQLAKQAIREKFLEEHGTRLPPPDGVSPAER